MSPNKRIYIRPDDNLPREEAVRQMVDEFLAFFAEEAEARGDHAAAARLRARLAADDPAADGVRDGDGGQ